MRIQKDDICSFVMSREQPDGGFGFAETAQATLEDTYYALQILHLLQIPYSNDKTAGFILSFNKSSLTIKHLFQVVYLSHILNLQVPSLNEAVVRFPYEKIRDSESMYYASRTAELIHNKESLDNIKNKGIKMNADEHLLSELCYKAITLKKSGILFDEQRVSEKIKKFQGYDGGFSFTAKGAPSFIEETYLAIEALAELATLPEDVDASVSFVNLCMADNGAYGRQITTVPTLDATYYAVAILKILEG